MTNLPEVSVDAVIQNAVHFVIGPILRVLQGDPHQWSNRPCETCRLISSFVGKPFGCYEYQRRRAGEIEVLK